MKYSRSFSMERSMADGYVYRGIMSDMEMLLEIEVNDGLVLSEDCEIVEDFLRSLQQEFEITTRDVRYFVELEIRRFGDESMCLSQEPLHQASNCALRSGRNKVRGYICRSR